MCTSGSSSSTQEVDVDFGDGPVVLDLNSATLHVLLYQMQSNISFYGAAIYYK
jgi:hypothetical protein